MLFFLVPAFAQFAHVGYLCTDERAKFGPPERQEFCVGALCGALSFSGAPHEVLVQLRFSGFSCFCNFFLDANEEKSIARDTSTTSHMLLQHSKSPKKWSVWKAGFRGMRFFNYCGVGKNNFTAEITMRVILGCRLLRETRKNGIKLWQEYATTILLG